MTVLAALTRFSSSVGTFPQPAASAGTPSCSPTPPPAATSRRATGGAHSNVPPPVGTAVRPAVAAAGHSAGRFTSFAVERPAPSNIDRLPKYVGHTTAFAMRCAVAANLAAAYRREDDELRQLIDQATRTTVDHPARRHSGHTGPVGAAAKATP